MMTLVLVTWLTQVQIHVTFPSIRFSSPPQVVEVQPNANAGDIVVAILNSNEFTVKELIKEKAATVRVLPTSDTWFSNAPRPATETLSASSAEAAE
jgi:hypothetical protein